MESLEEIFDRINKDDRSLFIAYMSYNFTYLSVNAFVRLLHDKYGYDDFSGYIINGQNDPSQGHSFAEDSFRFPEYCRVSIAHVYDDLNFQKKRSKYLKFAKNSVLQGKYMRDFFVLNASLDFKFTANAVALTNRRIIQVDLCTGGVELNLSRVFRMKSKEFIPRLMIMLCTADLVSFKPFNLISMKRNHEVENFFRKATKEEHLNVLGKEMNEKYVLYVSQGPIYSKHNGIIEDVLDKERMKGYKVYIKPHTHEREYSFPTKEGYSVLPMGYAVESLVAGAERKPDKVISFTSSSLFTCSAWYEVPCYSLVDSIPRSELGRMEKRFLRLMKSGEYPDMHLYGESV